MSGFKDLILHHSGERRVKPLLGTTITKQIGMVFFAILFLATANVVVVKNMLEDINGVAETVNVAGKLRMLSQKIAFESLKYASQNGTTEQNLTFALRDFETALNALGRGGAVFGFQIKKVSPQHVDEIEAIKTNWNNYRSHVEHILNRPPDSQSLAHEMDLISGDATSLLGSAEILVGSLTNEAHQAQALALAKIYGLLFLDAAVLALVVAAFRRKIIHPLHELLQGSIELAQGNYHARIKYRSVDEMGQLAKAFNHSAQQIGSLISRIEEDRKNIQRAETTFRGLAENSVVGVYIVQDNTFRFTNPKMAEMFHYRQDEMMSSVSIFDIVSESDRHVMTDNIHRRLNGGVVEVNFELRARRKDGTTFDVEVFGSKMDLDGNLATIGVMLDITERKRIDRALRVLVASNQALVHATEENSLLDEICKIVQQISGYPFVWVGYLDERSSEKVIPVAFAEQPGSTFFSTINTVTCDATEAGNGVTGRAIRSGKTIIVRDVPLHAYFEPWREFMERHDISSAISLPLKAGNKIIGALSMYSQDAALITPDEVKIVEELADNLAYGITALRADAARRHYAKQLEHNANHDSLTGLGNRNLLSERLRHAIALANRSHQMIAVLLLDLDHFKVVNDTLGHAAGDALLQAVAKRLLSSVRSIDTVSRLGGDEFVIVMPEVAAEENVVVVARKIIEVLSQSFVIAEQEIHIGVSIGISLYPRNGENEKVLLKNVDMAMYHAKQNGRANFNFYTEEMSARHREHNALQSDLHFALNRGELLLHYQPKVDIRTREIVGVEALIRWQHPERGLILPEKFIPLAEANGLIIPIGTWVMQTACAQNRTWQNAGFPHINVAVNISAWQFHKRDLVSIVTQVLADTGLDPRYLELELTESVIIQESDEAVPILLGLKALGVQLSMDDFGTGYSSLNYLQRFPFDYLKIDRVFVDKVASNTDNMAIVKAVIALAHSLKLKVTAEGVETEAELDFLHEYDCDEIQGYLFSKPVPPEQFKSLFANNGRPLHYAG